MDTIDFELQLIRYNEPNEEPSITKADNYDSLGEHEWYIGFRLIINGVTIDHSTDMINFIASAKTDAYEIFTCSCGNAGCAGIWDGIAIKVRKKTVEWRIPEGSAYPAIKRFHSFNRESYDKLRHELLEELRELSKHENVIDQFSQGMTLKENFHYYEKEFEGKSW